MMLVEVNQMTTQPPATQPFFYIRETDNPWEAMQGRKIALYEVWCDDGAFADMYVSEHHTREAALADIARREGVAA